MSRFQADTTIDRPVDVIWTYAADITRHPEWMASSDARVLSGDGTLVGARGQERVHLGPISMDIEFEVAEATPGHRILWRARDRRFRQYEVGLALEPSTDTSARATYHGDVAFRGRWRLFAPFIALEGPSAIRRELQRLKEQVESLPS